MGRVFLSNFTFVSFDVPADDMRSIQRLEIGRVPNNPPNEHDHSVLLSRPWFDGGLFFLAEGFRSGQETRHNVSRGAGLDQPRR